MNNNNRTSAAALAFETTAAALADSFETVCDGYTVIDRIAAVNKLLAELLKSLFCPLHADCAPMVAACVESIMAAGFEEASISADFMKGDDETTCWQDAERLVVRFENCDFPHMGTYETYSSKLFDAILSCLDLPAELPGEYEGDDDTCWRTVYNPAACSMLVEVLECDQPEDGAPRALNLRLTLGHQVRECSYEFSADFSSWEWVSGEDEPEMPTMLRDKWESSEGDTAISEALNKGESYFVFSL